MRVSSLDIRKQEFTKAFRGYEVDEVNAFLQMVAREFDEARDDHRRLEEQVRGLEEKIRHYERVEEALQEALQTARDSSRKAVQNAEERARLIVKNAESKAAEITHEAQSSLERMRVETASLGNRQHEIVARLRAFLTAETEMLNRFERNQLDEPVQPRMSLRDSSDSKSDRGRVESRTSRPSESPKHETVREKPAPRVPEVQSDDDEPEDVFNPAASEDDTETEMLASGAFNVRSLIARANEYEDEDEGSDVEESEHPRMVEEVSEDEDAEEVTTARESRDEARGREATEEIEKIRRILNDLD